MRARRSAISMRRMALSIHGRRSPPGVCKARGRPATFLQCEAANPFRRLRGLGAQARPCRTRHPRGASLEVLAMAIEIQPRLSTQDDGAHVLAAENVRGYDVRDVDNNHIGKVDDLIVEESSGRVRFLKIG